MEHAAATLDLLRRADLAPEGDVRADAQAVRKAVEQLLDEKAQNAKSNSSEGLQLADRGDAGRDVRARVEIACGSSSIAMT